MGIARISTFDKSHLASAIKVAANNDKTYIMKYFGDNNPKKVDIYRVVGDHCRHNIYNNRTGKCVTSTHVFPHGSVRYGDKEIWVTDLTSGQRYELLVDRKKDFFTSMREILPRIM